MTKVALSHLIAIALLLPALGCGSDPSHAGQTDAGIRDAATGDATTADATDPASGCVNDGDPFDPARLREHVGYLASEELAGRGPGTAGDVAAQPFASEGGGTTANVVAYLPGNDPAHASEIILVGAHHDHFGIDGGEIYNGANDNASGSVSLLAIAQKIQQRPEALGRTIAFVAFAEEEAGLLGSSYFVEHPPTTLPLADIVYMINLDMVGKYTFRDRVVAWGSFAGTPGRAILDGLVASHPGFNAQLGRTPPDGDSDFQPFCDAEIPYVYFDTGEEPCWHETCDDTDHLDYPQMAEIVALSYELISGLADSGDDLVAARAAGCIGP
jgi:Zn-dependent M28 family amino/carboxypeptidase